ncbi:polysaccharide deacetylase family protein [Winogradskyella eckloniae]|uniref:polysaccharide deacetylase family protein n=1 Tax=Winogradskyella eckloniae TaxID=1089306 RepID=UPI0015638513|nr:polysaccharide deacetylase family protein [Winogradskyella eckloniae]NRD20812.1 polysaccharide deacetylase family protein [Winogradskyella eckloniae]
MNTTKGKIFIKNALSPFFRGLYQGLGQIVVLHRVIPKSKEKRLRNTGIEITEAHLEDLIVYFKKRNYDFISLDELPDYLQGNIKKKFVIFTLDDGYVDNLTHAYPIFKRHNVPFTIYVTTNFPDKKAVLWWYLLEDLLLKEQKISFNLKEETYNFNLQSYAEQEETFNFLRHLIKSYEGEEQLNLIKTLFSKYNMPLYEKVEHLALNWNQIIELNSDPLVTIAAHTVNHPSFKAISDSQLLYEVNQSVSILESRLNSPVEHFAYPFGSPVEVGIREVELMSQTKIKTSTTGRKGNIMAEHQNHMHALPRLYVGPQTTERYLNDFVNGKISFVSGSKQRIVTV